MFTGCRILHASACTIAHRATWVARRSFLVKEDRSEGRPRGAVNAIRKRKEGL
jgi:hypothetical protein